MKACIAVAYCVTTLLLAAWPATSTAGGKLLQPGESAAEWAADPSMAKAWSEYATLDVNAAHRLLEENHPGAVPELGDSAFVKTLDTAYRTALARAKTVTTYEGYLATLAGFAVSMGDRHIWSRPQYNVARPGWAGILVSRRGGDWIVSDQDADSSYGDLQGAKLVGCDGLSVDEWAKRQLDGFRAIWSIEAQRISAAPWLFVDERNPFVSRPETCEFDGAGASLRVKLVWRPVKRADLLPRIEKAEGGGAAGFGVRPVGAGYWIALESLTGKAQAVVNAVRKEQEVLRSAPFVVLDLRGNHGGSSTYGRQIANSLMGADYVKSRLGGDMACDDQVWRVSPDNIAQLEYYRDVLIPTLGSPEATTAIAKLVADSKAARAANRPLSGPAHCEKPAVPSSAATHSTQSSLLRGRLILLTDHQCFSSCLIVTYDFRKLGALHVGEATNADTHYAEVREELLPSGLSKFSTQEAMILSMPARIGPFVPAISWQGNIADTAALEPWISGLVAGKPGT